MITDVVLKCGNWSKVRSIMQWMESVFRNTEPMHVNADETD